MNAIARAWKKAVGKALPGPWRPWLVVREALLALVMGGLAVLLEWAGHTGYAVPVGLGTAVLCLLRRAFPASVLLVTAAATGWAPGPFLLLVLAGGTAGARVRRAGPLVGTFVLSWVLFTVTGVLKDVGTASPKLLVGLSLGGFLLMAVLPALWGRYQAQRRELEDALRERNDQLVRERLMVVHQARLRERHRIAQDMHDSLGHQLALISVHSGALEVDRSLTDRQREAVGVLRQAAVAAMRELREVVGVLHDESTAVPPAPAGASGAPGRGGVDGIEGLVESSRAAGTLVSLSRDGERRPLAAAVDHAAYRIVQEALTNAHKHAPGAPIGVALRYEPDALVVEVTNPAAPEPVGVRAGTGQVVSGGQGLTGLRERARLVGGMVHAGQTPDQGFRLAAVLPYGGTADGAGDGVAGLAGVDDWVLEGLPPVADGGGARRRSPALGCAVGVVAVGLTVLGLLVWGLWAFVQATGDATVKTSVYDDVRLGRSEADVMRELPSGNGFFTDTFKGSGPPAPAGSHCRYYLSSDVSEKWDRDNVVRFCFKDGVLVDKQHYEAKN
ncbi:sensor histidine kinase [Streptomyces kaniharaensis]|uniref:histidine kinase n=1 Tax=Streptomyces kaniharaensis TaxID=212423 RepID=A0A6N7KVZ3_9ACTN|nr:histidine kinase [Streptomyces kaniharaensis]MQS15812.1 sensor histidine kinase [Streptomyces kaniharaensis]